MSSQLTNLVPILDGTNYQQWVATMQSFLMSQGQWKCVKEGADVPSEIKVEDSVTNAAEIVSWLEDAERAMGISASAFITLLDTNSIVRRALLLFG